MARTRRNRLGIALALGGLLLLALGAWSLAQLRITLARGPMLIEPFGIAVSSDGAVLVGIDGSRVHVYDARGTFLRSWDVLPSDVGTDRFRIQTLPENVVQVVGRGGKVLKHASRDAGVKRTRGPTREGQHAEGEHGGRASRTDVPREGPAARRDSGGERELRRSDREALGVCVAQLGAGPHRSQVLGTQPPLGATRTRIGDPNRSVEQGREGDRVAYDRAAPRLLRAVDVQHRSPSLAWRCLELEAGSGAIINSDCGLPGAILPSDPTPPARGSP